MKAPRKLIINADDAGINNERDDDLFRLLDACAITSLSVCFNGNSYRDLINRFEKSGYDADLGIHINLTEGRPVLPAEKVSTLVNSEGLMHGLGGFLKKWSANKIDYGQVGLEIEAQFKKALETEYKLTHVDSHHNIHLLHGAAIPIADAATGAGVKWFRKSSAVVIGAPVLDSNKLKYSIFNSATSSGKESFFIKGMFSTSGTVQFRPKENNYNLSALGKALLALKIDSVELVCHPYTGDDGCNLPDDMINRRIREHELLLAAAGSKWFEKNGIVLTRRTDLL